MGGISTRKTETDGTVLLVSLCETKRTVPAVSAGPGSFGVPLFPLALDAEFVQHLFLYDDYALFEKIFKKGG